MVNLNFEKLPHAMALTGPIESARREAQIMAEKLVEDVRIGVLNIEPEGNAIKLEAATRINDFLSLSRLTKSRVIIVSEAQLLNPQATNAILKIVEEPPPGTHFLFLVPEISQLLPTLRSRVQVIRLKAEARVLDEEQKELRDVTARFVKSCFKGQRTGIGEFLEAAKDRETAASAAHLLQLILRDWTVGQDANDFPDWDTYSRVQLWRVAHQVEVDLHGNIDRSLAFENFFYRVNAHVD